MDTSPLPDIDKLWKFSDPAASAAAFEALLAEHGTGAGLAWRAQLCSQLARTHGLRADFAGAHALLDEAAALAQAAERAGEEAAGIVLARVRIALERGRCHNSGGDPAEGVPLFEQALELAAAAGLDNLAVDAAHMLAIAVPGEAGLDWNRRAIELAEGSADQQARQWRASLLNNQGWGVFNLERYAEALEWFERALAARREQGGARGIQIAHWCIARCLRALGRVEESLARQRQLAADELHINQPDGFIEEELGECLLALGQLDAARAHFARAGELLTGDALFARNNGPRLERLRALGAGRDVTA